MSVYRGLLSYIAILILAAVVSWQVARKDEGLRPFAIGIFAGIVTLQTFGLLDAHALGARPNILFWMALGLLSGLGNMVVFRNL